MSVEDNADEDLASLLVVVVVVVVQELNLCKHPVNTN